jgi:regulatory protein
MDPDWVPASIQDPLEHPLEHPLERGDADDVALEIEGRALRLLAGREHSRAELRRKLTGRGYPAELTDRVLAALEKRGLLSERRYAESYIASRQRRGYGPLRIRAELRERGIETAEIESRLDPGDEQWWGIMLEIAERRFGAEPPGDRREQGRRGRFLQQRGFPPAMIRRLLWGDGDS